MQRQLEQQRRQLTWRKPFAIMAITLFAIGSVPATTFAQSEADEEQVAGVLEEVIVTSARRREENVQDVPIAVSLLSSDQIEKYNIMDLGDLSKIVPNSNISAGRATNSTIVAYIRGVGQSDPLWGFEPGVGVYMDDVFIARPQGGLLDVYDVQSIRSPARPAGNALWEEHHWRRHQVQHARYRRRPVRAGNGRGRRLQPAGRQGGGVHARE